MSSMRATWRLTAVLGCLVAFNMGGCPILGGQGLFGGGLFGGLFGGGGNGDPNAMVGSDPNTTGDMTGDNSGDTTSNDAPTVDAGSDRTVLRGDSVSLTGTANDPDGDSLTYLWEQTGGTSVSLTNAATLTVSFTAPGVAGTLTFRLTINDGNGHVVSDTVLVEVTIPPAFLFVANNDSGRITSHSSDAIDGEVVPTTALNAGSATSLFQVRSILVTPGGILFASRQNGGIVVYDDALNADGDTAASRVVDGNNTLLDAPISLAYDAATDTLYVGDADAEHGVLAFANATQPSYTGDIAPTRMFTPSDRFPYSGSIHMVLDALWIAADGSLYASDTSGSNVNSSRILVWTDPSAANNETNWDRQITCTAFGNIEDIVTDAAGRLYVVDGSNHIYVFDDASTLSDAVTPDATITIDGSPTPEFHGIAVDSSGVGYVSDRQNDAVYSLADIATLDGSVPVDTILDGFDSRIAGPRQLWVYEP